MPILKRLALAATCAFAVASTTALSRAQDTQKVAVAADNLMKYDVTEITGKVGQKLVITLTNNGTLPKIAMGHNLLILMPGTDWATVSAAAKTHAADDYIPDELEDQILVHTKLLGPGESDTITFTPHAAGVYQYLCTFPAHAQSGMHGTITVK